MDQNLLVSSAQSLIKAMDEGKYSPRAAIWVHNSDAENWKLWLVPPIGVTDERSFYMKVSEIVAGKGDALEGIDASDTKMVLDTHPAMIGLRNFIRMEGLGAARFHGNRFNGYYLPEGIILRSAA